MIEVRNLTKKYGSHTVVNHLNFTIESGRVYGFLGPNGAGKSTTMNMVTGCLAPTEGQVLIDGHDIFDDAVAAKKEIGYLPELPPVYPDMTPYEYLRFVAEAKGIKASEIPEAVVAVMEETSIFDYRNRLIKNLSKGYRQRVGIAQAMLGNPSLIILDEPTVGLDPRQIIEIRDLIKRLGEKRTIILSSHILSEVQAVCDYVMIINHGNLVASDTLENIKETYTPDDMYSITARINRESLDKILSNLDGIKDYSVEGTEDKNIFIASIEAKPGYELGELLFRAFAATGFTLLRLEKVEPSLEEIFLKLTETYEEDEDEEGKALPADSDSDDSDDTDEEEEEDDEDGDDSDGDDSDGETDEDYKPMFGKKEDDE